jgi:hypothetical protein
MATAVATTTLEGLLGRVRELEPLIREYALRAERERRLAQPVSDALRDAGFFRIFRPASRGDGLELDPVTAFRLFEELSRIDSAVGWNVVNANAAEVLMAWYSDHVTEEVCGSPETVMAGAWNPPERPCPRPEATASRVAPSSPATAEAQRGYSGSRTSSTATTCVSTRAERR